MVVLSKISPPKFTFQWGPRSLKWDTFEDEVGCICEVLIAMLEDADEALEQTVDGQQDEIQEHTSALKDRIGGYVQWFRRALQSWSAAYQKQISDDINQMVVLLEQQMLLPEVKKVPPTTCLSLWARIVGLKKGLTFGEAPALAPKHRLHSLTHVSRDVLGHAKGDQIVETFGE